MLVCECGLWGDRWVLFAIRVLMFNCKNKAKNVKKIKTSKLKRKPIKILRTYEIKMKNKNLKWFLKIKTKMKLTKDKMKNWAKEKEKGKKENK